MTTWQSTRPWGYSMRRTIRTLLVGGVLLSAAACGTASGTPTVAGSPAPSVNPAVSATCQALAGVYGNNMAVLAESLANYVADRKAVAQAQGSLAAFAVAVAEATKASEDTQMRADGKTAADRMSAKAADPKFFAAIKTTKDVDQTMGPTLTEWLSPIARHCS